jgi:hypothetical protein
LVGITIRALISRVMGQPNDEDMIIGQQQRKREEDNEEGDLAVGQSGYACIRH